MLVSSSIVAGERAGCARIVRATGEGLTASRGRRCGRTAPDWPRFPGLIRRSSRPRRPSAPEQLPTALPWPVDSRAAAATGPAAPRKQGHDEGRPCFAGGTARSLGRYRAGGSGERGSAAEGVDHAVVVADRRRGGVLRTRAAVPPGGGWEPRG